VKRWEERIDEARRRRVLLGLVSWPGFTGEDRRLASDWRTCVVGEMRRRYGVRLNGHLGRLGIAFYHAVVRNDLDTAALLRQQVEEYALTTKGREWETARAPSPAAQQAAH